MSQPDQRSLEALASLKLTPREAEVLFWISEGKSNQNIGVILGASTRTICKHVEHIFGKLSVENRTAAAVVALETYRPAAAASELNPVNPGLRSPVLSRCNCVHYGRIIPNFAVKSRG